MAGKTVFGPFGFMDMEAVIKGILSGLAYGLLLGPLFFLSLKVTFTQSLRNGLALAVGAFISDALLVAGSWLSAGWLTTITEKPLFKTGLGIASGLLLLGFGISALLPRRHKLLTAGHQKLPPHLPASALQGFLVNLSNPSNWIFWLSLATAARTDAPAGNSRYTLAFLICTLITVFGTDMTKVVIAYRLGQQMKPGGTNLVIRIAGIILLIVSVWILWRAIRG